MRRNQPDIARLYHHYSSHERTSLVEPTIDYDLAPLRYRTYPDAERTLLPGRDFAIAMPLGEAIEKRRSLREYVHRPLPLETLGRLLHTAYGVIPAEPVCTRPAPSAGGRYPLELYVATRTVEGLADGIHHYDAPAHALELVRPGLVNEELVDLTVGQDVARDANVVLILTAIRDRTMWKYGQRGYRHVLLDAGHVGQNVYLVATALGLGPTAIGGFYDAELAALMKLPPDEEPFYVLVIGQPAP